MELKRCDCSDPWKAHPNGFKWDNANGPPWWHYVEGEE